VTSPILPPRYHSLLAALFFWVGVNLSSDAYSGTLFLESANQGTIGIPGGQSISNKQYWGWRFHLDVPLHLTDVGGHLLGTEGDLFAAVLSLSAIDAFPEGSPFSATETVATVTFTPPAPSNEILVPLTAILAPGDYALVFGSGRFEATGTGAIPNNLSQPDIPPTTPASYMFWSQIDVGEYRWRTNQTSMMRFVVQGVELAGTADFELDGDVDSADLEIWQDHFGSNNGASISTGDADGDSDTDGTDFLAWQRQVGNSLSSLEAVQAVPEPGGGNLMTLVCAIAFYQWLTQRKANTCDCRLK